MWEIYALVSERKQRRGTDKGRGKKRNKKFYLIR